MNSMIALINFLLLYSLKQNRYDKIIFLLTLRMIYIYNYRNQIYNTMYKSHPILSAQIIPKNNISKANIGNINLNNKDSTFHNKSNAFTKFNGNSNKEFKESLNNNFQSKPTNINNKNFASNISKKNIDCNYMEGSRGTRQKDSESNNDNVINYSKNNEMKYDLDSLIGFLTLYRNKIPNCDDAILTLIILNYYIRFLVLPTMFNQSISNEEDDDADLISEYRGDTSLDSYTDLEENQNRSSRANDNLDSILESNNKQQLEPKIDLEENIQSNTRKKIATKAINNKYLTNKNFIHNYIYSLTSTITQVPLIKNIKLSEFNDDTGNFFDVSQSTAKFKKKVPVLITSFNVDDVFKGDLVFNNFIVDINNINNMIFINDTTFMVDIKDNVALGTVFLEGYLKTSADALIPVEYSENLLSSMYRNNIIYTSFSLAQTLELSSNSFKQQIAYNNLEVEITQVSSNTKRILKQSKKINNYFEFYSRCELIIEVNYTLNIYTTEDVTI